jgi:hypothetical protein
MHETAQFDAVNPAISLAAVHDRRVVFAQDEQGRLIHIDSVRRGKACNCRCLACNETLIARHGEIKAHSFAHMSGTECQYAIDAMLNRLASELIAARGCFRTPALTVAASRVGPLGAIERDETIPSRHLRVESVRIDRCVHRQRPSVVMLVKGRELILEMTHAHRLDAHKRAAIEKFGLPAIELHLADCKFETVEQFEYVLVDDTRHKHWIFNPKAIEIQTRLDAIVQQQLAIQNTQHAQQLERQIEQQRHEQAALEAAKLERKQRELAALEERLRLQAQQDHLMCQEQARLDSIARAASQEPAEAHRQTLHFHMQDGGLMIRHEQGRQVLIVPETGNERALGMLAKLGLTYNPEQGGYPTTAAELPNILPALMSFVKGVRSV